MIGLELGRAHERDTDTGRWMPGTRDSDVDLDNNAVGARTGVEIRQAIGSHAPRLFRDASREHIAELEQRLTHYLDDGTLTLDRTP